MSPQQMITVPTPIKGVKKTEVVMICSQRRTGFAQRNPYAMDVDRGRNCYACREFGHLVRYYRNGEIENRIGEGRKLEYGGQKREKEGNGQENLNGEGNLIVFD